jgi:hypothetical protein
MQFQYIQINMRLDSSIKIDNFSILASLYIVIKFLFNNLTQQEKLICK